MCTEELQQWHVPKKIKSQNAVLFEDLTFPQDSYEKDKKGRKRPAVQGKRVEYTSSFEKMTKTHLKSWFGRSKCKLSFDWSSK